MIYSNFVGGYGFGNTMNTGAVEILTPIEWQTVKDGPGFWFTPKAMEENLNFSMRMCDVAGAYCKKDDRRQINDWFEKFTKAKEKYEKQVLLTPIKGD